MEAYKEILKKILEDGVHKPTRTGIDTISITGYQFEHNINDGFPLLTTKKMGVKSIFAELEFFIKGLSDKKWLQDRNCHIWDEWANPEKVQKKVDKFISLEHQFSLTDDRGLTIVNNEKKKIQKEESDLGRIYGVQWRQWRTSHIKTDDNLYEAYRNTPVKYYYETIDQLADVIERAKKNPLDRRLLVTAWRPDEIHQMALPPCHHTFQILSDGINLDLIWMQRSCDTFLGIPYNIASYAMLLLLLSKELKLKPNKLVGQLGDVHIYENHVKQVKEQLSREPYKLPNIIIPDENWNGIFKWEYTDFILENYKYHPKITASVAV